MLFSKIFFRKSPFFKDIYCRKKYNTVPEIGILANNLANLRNFGDFVEDLYTFILMIGVDIRGMLLLDAPLRLLYWKA